MYHSFLSLNNLTHTEKYIIYNTYSLLIRNPKPYLKISINEMISECLKFYSKNKNIFLEIYSDEEIEQLINDLELKEPNYPLIHNLIHFFFCAVGDMEKEDFSLSLETKDMVLESLEYYKQNKEKIIKDKYYEYFLVGLFRSYGILTMEDIIKLFKLYNVNIIPYSLLNRLYVKRFVMQSNDDSNLYCLLPFMGKEVELYPKRKFIDNIIHTKEELVERGKHYFIEQEYKYQVASSYESFTAFKYSLPMDEIIVDIGIDEEVTNAMSFVDDLCDQLLIDQEVKSVFYDLLYDLPSFVYDSYENKLKQTDVTIFYKLFYPFIKYCAEKYSVPLFDDIHHENIFLIFNKLVKTKFKIIDEFIENNEFTEEEVEILQGFKRFKSGPFLIINNEFEGTIFFDRKDFYLVKGLDQSVEAALQLEPPRFAETILVPFKDQIVYFAILRSWESGFDQASIIRLQRSYEALRSSVIKKL